MGGDGGYHGGYAYVPVCLCDHAQDEHAGGKGRCLEEWEEAIPCKAGGQSTDKNRLVKCRCKKFRRHPNK